MWMPIREVLEPPFLNLDITEVEGILVRGTRDFTVDYGDGIICMRPERCSDGEGCPAWADVSRTTTFSSPLPSYAVRLGPDTKNLQLVVSGLVCPSWKPSGLAVGTTYYCAVIAHHHAGEVAGPLWTFNTKP